MASQVSVFVENKPGRISRIARILGDEGISIRAITISDMGDYGLINIISNDPEGAAEALADDGRFKFGVRENLRISSEGDRCPVSAYST